MNKYYTITKVMPGDVYFMLQSLTGNGTERLIKLTTNTPFVRVPKDYALYIFADATLFKLYEDGYFTFDENEELINLAIEEGIYFGDVKKFKPVDKNLQKQILDILKSGKREAILALLNNKREMTVQIAKDNYSDLTTSVIKLIEETVKVQIVIDGE